MKPKSLQRTGYNIVIIVFLVIALSVISVITSISNKNSNDLSLVVKDLSQNKFEIDKIDEAIQLLYKAENNSRLYVLTRDMSLYSVYLNQLNEVASLILSVQKDDEQNIDNLVADKKNKTEIYIAARLLADSLMQDRSIVEDAKEPIPVIERIYIEPAPVIIDAEPEKKVDEHVVESKSRKGIFGRIRDAIVNKPVESKVTNVTINSTPTAPLAVTQQINGEANVIQPTINTTSSTDADQSAFSKLSEKERALLVANDVLFQELKVLLQNLKEENIRIQRQRQAALSNNAFQLVNDLKNNNNYNLILSLLLTFIILSVLLALYKNMRALQNAKLSAENYAKYKSEFIATLSHEIRTPLHSIHAFTDELTKTHKEEGESEIINAIKLSSNMLISVVNNILDFTKMEQGKFKLNHAPFVPAIVLDEVISGLTIQASRKNLLLVKNIEDTADIKVYGDAFQFRQVLVNLISNAIKYTEEGSITVSAKFGTKDQITGLLEVGIKDTGIGIARERLPYIFDEFNSQNFSTEIKEGSSGLGLSIVKKIVDYHKGKINATSELGVGTLFEVKLPFDIFLEKENTAVLAANSKPLRKILIVENDQLNIKILNLIFVNENYLVSNSFDGNEAFENYVNNDFDIIITDISMPGLNGYELARKIRELPDSGKSRVPIIAISGYEPPEDFQTGGKSDINEWITKPFDLDTLLVKVEKVLAD